MRTRSMQASLAALAALALLAAGAPAAATAPIQLSGPVTDRVAAVAGDEDRIEAAIADLESETGIGLYVAYIDDFGGYTTQEWADATAVDSGLGTEDLLLVIATEERRYTWSVAAAFPLTDGQLNEVASERIAPELADDEWAEAAIGAAEGYKDAYRGGSGSSGSSAVVWVLILLVVAAVVIGLVLWRRGRGKATSVGAPSAGRQRKLTVEQLDNEANRLLVETDDAIRTSEQELGFAEAEFGTEQTAAFAAVLEAAKAELSASFKLRQELDDDIPETEPQQREMLAAIIEKLVKANKDLDAKAAGFDKLRDLGRRAPEAAAALKERAAVLAPKITAARGTVEDLQRRYPATARATVKDFPGTAEDRLHFAAAQLDAAEAAVDAGERGRAAVLVRAAEEATAQAEQAVDAVARRAVELDDAAARLPGVLTEADAEAAEAERLAAGSGAAAKAARLRGAVAAIRSAEGPVDPLEAVAAVERASAELDRELQAVRDAAQNAQRAREQFDRVLMSAQSTTAAVEDYVNTNRGAVGPEARTRLNEAKQELSRALALKDSDPSGALERAHRADELANAASAAAQRDVQGYLGPRQTAPSSGGNAGAILGGILLGGMLGGSGRSSGRRYGGGFSGGSGGRRGGGPGSFGGGGTRGRRGGGGRF
ncbi:TPM domain-containing protein [Glycomyces sp. NRRL B-16210]|uniref:TPM domain-containing protein n=1 Tax=Glycomyces sp. NRRL B-16210 TaxID=1463821 RepID=UPI000B0DF46B|nr:TPM domain-containing protein [Glycomyces sp. NRRL B-16210]